MTKNNRESKRNVNFTLKPSVSFCISSWINCQIGSSGRLTALLFSYKYCLCSSGIRSIPQISSGWKQVSIKKLNTAFPIFTHKLKSANSFSGLLFFFSRNQFFFFQQILSPTTAPIACSNLEIIHKQSGLNRIIFPNKKLKQYACVYMWWGPLNLWH